MCKCLCIQIHLLPKLVQFKNVIYSWTGLHFLCRPVSLQASSRTNNAFIICKLCRHSSQKAETKPHGFIYTEHDRSCWQYLRYWWNKVIYLSIMIKTPTARSISPYFESWEHHRLSNVILKHSIKILDAVSRVVLLSSMYIAPLNKPGFSLCTTFNKVHVFQHAQNIQQFALISAAKWSNNHRNEQKSASNACLLRTK